MTTSSRTLRRRAAWSAPVLTAAAIGAATLLPAAASADPHPSLPAKSPAQLLAAVQTADVSTLSGTIVETARLGLPSLPGADSSAALTWQTLVTGTHTARVWLDGADKQRLALLGQLAESDVVHNGRDVWTYASDTQTVGHTLLPADTATKAKTAQSKAKDLQRYTPQGAATEALKAIDPSTVVTVDRTARVAGQPAYTLVLTPRDTRSTVRKVLIAIDAKHNVPLRVQVFGKAAAPAFETAFTNISYNRPAASVFAFTPPKGAKVTNDVLGLTGAKPEATTPEKSTKAGTTTPSPTVIGTGWTSILVVPAAKDGTSALDSLTGGAAASKNHDSSGAVLSHLTTTLPNGDHLLQSALINVLLTKDGRALVGAVSPAVLEQAAAGHVG
jgi:outer membrane lipoprotein-sorting protein